MKTTGIIYLAFILFFYSCADGKKEKKELTGPHAEIQLFITNSFSTSISGLKDSLHIYEIPKNKTVNDHYSVLLQSNDLVKKVLVKLGRKGTDSEAESIRESMKFSTIENTEILQIELYFGEEKFACAFLDSLVETFNEEVMTQLYESSRRKIDVISAQIDSVAMKLHELEESMRNDNAILNLDHETSEYFEAYIKLEKKSTYLKKLKDCLNRDFEICLSGFVPDGSTEDEYLTRALNDLYKLNTEKNQIQCPTAGNEVCKKLDKKISELKSDLDTYLKNSLLAIDEQLNQYEAYMKKLPKTEREISKEFDINQKLYMFLLEKKTEMLISMAGVVYPIRMVDRARWVRK